MGMWNISIEGVGAHHNKEYPLDADRMAQAFVKQLREAGHIVEKASFTYGGREVLKIDFAPDREVIGAAYNRHIESSPPTAAPTPGPGRDAIAG